MASEKRCNLQLETRGLVVSRRPTLRQSFRA